MAVKRREVVDQGKKLARYRSTEVLFLKLDQAKLGTTDLEEFFLGFGAKKRGGANTMGQQCREVVLTNLLRDRLRDVRGELRRAGYLYHKYKEEWRGVMESESMFRREMATIKEELKVVRREADEKNDRD